MNEPSSRTHLYRLAFVLIVGFVVFVGVMIVAAPASWNYEIANWYRTDALEELQQQPMVYGGIEEISARQRNKSCRSCHEDDVKGFVKLRHKQLSCESCHGALFDHVRDGKKVAVAVIDRERGQCLNCHAPLPNRPRGFPQFTTEENKKHMRLEEGASCLKCHDAHDPTP